MNLRRIKENYDTGLWSEKMVRDAVKVGFITEAEYYYITGKIYGRENQNDNTET